MSGICAIVRIGRPIDRAALTAAVAALGGRAVAHTGEWIGGDAGVAVGVGAALQDFTPEDPLGRQPVVSDDGRVVLVADARLDDREYLARALGIANSALPSVSDAHLISAAYRRWGDDCPRYLLGDFAFVAWDAHHRRLLCARDHIGQRALVYRTSPDAFAVASSAESLVRLDGGWRRLDLEKVADFMVLAEDSDRTFYEGVKRVPPAHTLAGDGRATRLEAYWSLDRIRAVRLGSDDAYVEAFREIWDNAVRCRLRSRSPAGLMLSGGLDSSSVAATAALLLRPSGGQLFAYHAAPRAGFVGPSRPGWINDESDDVRAIADLHENIRLEVVRPDGRTFLDGLGDLLQHTCLPVLNTDNRPWFEAILQRSAERGLRVMLGGFKGNATISYTGIRGLRLWAYTGRWRKFVREARALATVRRRPARHIMLEMLQPPLPPTVRAVVRAARRRPVPPLLQELHSPIHPEFARERRVEARLRKQRLDPRFDDRSTGLAYRLRIVKRTGDAADTYRGLRALYGVELRDPTADLRVVEFCLGIPDDQYLRAGRERQLVRRAMRGMLPDRVLNRTTRGAQGADWPERLTAMRGTLRAELDGMATSDTARRCIDVARLRQLIDDWPAVLTNEHAGDYAYRLPAGVMMGAFVRWFETGSCSGEVA